MSKLLVDGTYAINIVKLKDIAEKKTTKNIYGLVTETFTNSAENGIISQSDFFDRTITNDKNISGYFIVEPDDFVYNPRISTFAPVGPINRNKLGRSGVMSPLYLVFHTHDVEPEYLEWYFKSNAWHQFMRDNGNTGARSDRFSISDAEFFNMPIPIPPVKVQKAIAKTLTALDTKVTLEKNEVEKFQNLKSAMLTKMFPKKGGNVPEIRFDGFTDVWEQRKLGDLCVEFRSGEFISASDITETGEYPVFGGNGLRGFTDRFNHDGEYTLIGRQGALCGNVNFAVGKSYFTEHAIAVRADKKNQTRFLYYLFSTMDLGQYSGQSAQPGLAVGNLVELKSTLPDKQEQENISGVLTALDALITLHQRKYEKLIDTKKAFLEKLIGGEK